jgi:hypothetical protein
MTHPNINNMEMDALMNFYFPAFLGIPLLVLVPASSLLPLDQPGNAPTGP